MTINAKVVGSVPMRRKNYFHFLVLVIAALSSVIRHAMSRSVSVWRTECLKTRFPLSTLFYTEYDVKLKILKKIILVSLEGNFLLTIFIKIFFIIISSKNIFNNK